MKELLMLISGIAWTIVYIEIIKSGFKFKTYVMPVFALGLNFAWESIYAVDDLLIQEPTIQGWVNLVWASLDVVIVFTYFKYGKKYFTANSQKYFIPYSILVFVTCFIMQLAFYFQFPSVPASQYSAFAQNAAMSIMFVELLYRRTDKEGQTMLMAISKCVGTLVPTILGGILEGINYYILLMGTLCFIFDLIYIFQLYNFKRNEIKV